MTTHLRATKIICTLGPATESPEMMRDLINAGANLFRLNMSHGRHDWARLMVERVRSVAAEMGTSVGIFFDLQGPSIRTGDLAAPYELRPGDAIEFRKNDAEARLPYSTTINYEGLMEDVNAEDTIIVDNGGIIMKVMETTPDRIICNVLTEGTFGSRRHINLPGVALRLPALTEKDHGDLALALECDTDYVAMSFVRSAEHIKELRDLIEAAGSTTQIIAKIEDQQAVRNLDDIILASDVIMVARGDLGIEVNIEELPIIQRRIARKCRQLRRRVIIATHMLESMITQPTPTRAEVSDVSNAIYEQVDAVMLSGETSVGLYPVRCVETLDKIARRIESEGVFHIKEETQITCDRQRIFRAAVKLTDSMPNARLLVFTRRGVSAVYASIFRPEHSSIFAFSNNPKVVRQLSLARGVYAFEAPFIRNQKHMVSKALDILHERDLIEKGQTVIGVSDSLHGDLLVDAIFHLQV